MKIVKTLLMAGISSALAFSAASAFANGAVPNKQILANGTFYSDASGAENSHIVLDAKTLSNGLASNHEAVGSLALSGVDPKSREDANKLQFYTSAKIDCVKSLGDGKYAISGIKLAGSYTSRGNITTFTQGDLVSGIIDVATNQRSNFRTGQENCTEVEGNSDKFCQNPSSWIAPKTCDVITLANADDQPNRTLFKSNNKVDPMQAIDLDVDLAK